MNSLLGTLVGLEFLKIAQLQWGTLAVLEMLMLCDHPRRTTHNEMEQIESSRMQAMYTVLAIRTKK